MFITELVSIALIYHQHFTVKCKKLDFIVHEMEYDMTYSITETIDEMYSFILQPTNDHSFDRFFFATIIFTHFSLINAEHNVKIILKLCAFHSIDLGANLQLIIAKSFEFGEMNTILIKSHRAFDCFWCKFNNFSNINIIQYYLGRM